MLTAFSQLTLTHLDAILFRARRIAAAEPFGSGVENVGVVCMSSHDDRIPLNIDDFGSDRNDDFGSDRNDWREQDSMHTRRWKRTRSNSPRCVRGQLCIYSSSSATIMCMARGPAARPLTWLMVDACVWSCCHVSCRAFCTVPSPTNCLQSRSRLWMHSHEPCRAAAQLVHARSSKRPTPQRADFGIVR